MIVSAPVASGLEKEKAKEYGTSWPNIIVHVSDHHGQAFARTFTKGLKIATVSPDSDKTGRVSLHPSGACGRTPRFAW
jgi:hypothetical protein